jgi:hypothetical protein
MNILDVLPRESEVLIEYQPRAHEWITEAVLGVRASDEIVTIMGVTDAI